MPKWEEKAGAVLTSAQELMPEVVEALEAKAREGLTTAGAAKRTHVSEARIRRAMKTPQGSQLMRRIKREMKLPDRLGKDELLFKIQKWIEKEEVKEDARLPDLVGAAMNYARLCGYLEAPKVAIQQNTVNVAGGVSFSSILQRVKDGASQPALTENAASDTVDV